MQTITLEAQHTQPTDDQLADIAAHLIETIGEGGLHDQLADLDNGLANGTLSLENARQQAINKTLEAIGL